MDDLNKNFEDGLATFVAEGSEFNQDDIEEALSLLAKKRTRDEKIKSGEIKGSVSWAEMSDEQKEQRRAYGKVRGMKQKLLIAKAVEAGIVVTDEEVTEAMND